MQRFEEEVKKDQYILLNERDMLFFQDWAQYANQEKCYIIEKTKLIDEVLCEKNH